MKSAQQYIESLKRNGLLSEDSKIVDEDLINVVNELEIENDEIDESNVTANADGYNIPGAFSSAGDDEEQHARNIQSNAEQLGYKYPQDKKKRNTIKMEGKNTFGELAIRSIISEETYRQFKGNPDMTPKQKINKRIKEINNAIFKLEQVINQTHKLKNESGIDQSHLWEHSKLRLEKIANRIKKLSHKIVDLGA